MDMAFDVLRKIKLFDGISETDMRLMLSCLGATTVDVDKGEFVLMAGEAVNNIGIIIDGNAHIIKEDSEGGRVILSVLSKGDFFGETLCCVGVKESPVSVISISKTKILLLQFKRILKSCTNSCLFHTKIIENMLYVIANKNIALQMRMDIISKKTLRMKVITYLEYMSEKQGDSITTLLSREEMADFLCVDRSSLSHELSRMKKDGLIDYHKSNFKLLK